MVKCVASNNIHASNPHLIPTSPQGRGVSRNNDRCIKVRKKDGGESLASDLANRLSKVADVTVAGLPGNGQRMRTNIVAITRPSFFLTFNIDGLGMRLVKLFWVCDHK